MTAEQRRWLEDKGSRKKKGQSKVGSSLQPGSSLRKAQDQSAAQHSRKDSNVKMKIAGPAARTADYPQLDRCDVLLA